MRCLKLILFDGNTDIFIISGDGGLEVHGHGAGQALSVALHPHLLDGHSLYHSESSKSVRYEGTY